MFVTEAGTPTTTAWFLRMVQRTGRAAKLPFPVHPHMLRHSTDTSLLMMGMMPDRWRTISDIAICNRRRGTLRWLKEGSRSSGKTSFRAETNNTGLDPLPIEASFSGPNTQRLNVGRARDFSTNSRGW